MGSVDYRSDDTVYDISQVMTNDNATHNWHMVVQVTILVLRSMPNSIISLVINLDPNAAMVLFELYKVIKLVHTKLTIMQNFHSEFINFPVLCLLNNHGPVHIQSDAKISIFISHSQCQTEDWNGQHWFILNSFKKKMVGIVRQSCFCMSSVSHWELPSNSIDQCNHWQW